MNTVPQRVGGDQVVLDKLKENIFSTLHVATIGVVTEVDNSVITVKPIIKERAVGTYGEIQWLDLPEIPDTPFIGASPNVGDSVLLIFCDGDISGWITSGGTNADGTPAPVEQEILRSHSLSNAVAITGLSTNVAIQPSVAYGSVSGTKTDSGIGVSEALVNMIKNWEGFVGTPYQDSGGVWTIGYGHTFTPPWTGANPMSEAQGEDLLKADISPRVDSVHSIFSGMTFTQNQMDALVSFVYNAGAGNLNNSGLTKDIKEGASSAVLKVDFESICHDHQGHLLAGLVHRRDAEWAMYCNGTYLNDGK